MLLPEYLEGPEFQPQEARLVPRAAATAPGFQASLGTILELSCERELSKETVVSGKDP